MIAPTQRTKQNELITSNDDGQAGKCSVSPQTGLGTIANHVSICVKADNMPTVACTNKVRTKDTEVTILSRQKMGREEASKIESRLREWDPYWKTIRFIGLGFTTAIKRSFPQTELINTAAQFKLVLPFNDDGKRTICKTVLWGESHRGLSYASGEKVLLLRMLPVNNRSYKTKRADNHLWPKGTFLQINGKPTRIQQRRQQAHNLIDWKGQSSEINLAKYISTPWQKNVIDICCFDDHEYIFAVTFSEYQSADWLPIRCVALIPSHSRVC
jgi:hypothetical protein